MKVQVQFSLILLLVKFLHSTFSIKKRGFFFWGGDCPFSVLSILLVDYFQKQRMNTPAERQMEHRKQVRMCQSCESAGQKFLKKKYCQKFTFHEIRASFYSVLVDWRACTERTLFNQKLQENLLSELSQLTLNNILKIITQ